MRNSRAKGKIRKVIFNIFLLLIITLVGTTAFMAYKNEPIEGKITVKTIDHPELKNTNKL